MIIYKPGFLVAEEVSIEHGWFSNILVTVLYCLAALYSLYNMIILLIKEHGIESSDTLVSVFLGIMYGGGILLSGVLRPSTVVGFFTITRWNPVLLVVMLTVVGMNQLIFYLILGKPQPILTGNEADEGYQLIEDEVRAPRHERMLAQQDATVDMKTMWGAGLFGAGWALCGLCPGAIISGGVFAYGQAINWVMGYVFGTNLLKLCSVVQTQARNRRIP